MGDFQHAQEKLYSFDFSNFHEKSKKKIGSLKIRYFSIFMRGLCRESKKKFLFAKIVRMPPLIATTLLHNSVLTNRPAPF